MLARRPDVELVRVGEWNISTGTWDAAPSDLTAAIAALACPAVQKPIVKIGHTDKRFTPGDGEPAIGWYENLRVADGGHTLIADQVAPAWLTEVQAAAWPNRSIEGTYNKRCGLGHRHPFVLEAVSLLGVTPPGVATLKPLNSLTDVQALFGIAASDATPGEGEVRIVASLRAAADDSDDEPVHTGAMVALIPRAEDAERLAVDGGEPADELHVTLAYLGDAAEFSPKARAAVIDAVRRATVDTPTVEAHGFYIAAFNPPGSTPADGKERDTCLVLGISGDDMEYAQALAASAAQVAALTFSVDLPEQHKPWVPHLTLIYSDDLDRVKALADRTGPITFDRVRVAFAGERVDIPLTAMADSPLPGIDPSPELEVPNVLMPVAAASDGRLRNYWVRGEGAAKIRWNTPGDFTRCVRHLRKHVRDPKGLCAEYHHEATGVWPGDRRNVHASKEDNPMPNPRPDVADRIKTAWNATAPVQQYIVQVRASDVIVMDDTDRATYRVPVTLDGDAVVFGERQPVALDYVPADTVAASVAVYASREESRPDTEPTVPPPLPDPPPTEPDADPAATPEAPATDGGFPVPPAAEPDNAPSTEPKEDPVSTLSTDVRSRLGLTDDADEQAMLAAIDELKSKADTAPTPDQIAASAAEADDLRKEVKVLASQVQTLSSKLAATEAEKAATVKASVLDDAVKLGKIAPADKEQWERDYDEAPGAITRVLASIAPGTAVPIAAAGTSGPGEPDTTDDLGVTDDALTRWADQMGVDAKELTRG
ncbi:phage protease [Micromonospora chalcea]|uniref:phage protease n=1 Tax=Micromonospora chalcea TaxID=1874 RepID=UPI0037FC5EB0